MTLKWIKDFFKSTFGWQEGISIGKIDNNLEKAICFYDSRHPSIKIGTVGGKENKSFDVKSLTILLRWTTNADEAEQKANEIYDFFDEKTFTHDGQRVFVISRYEGPIGLGTDDRGVYEYSFEFEFYSAKLKEE
ncbi:MAG: minor capsid protein [Acutalibacteraceae bacterium]|nr:minor capsid protein [Acutalibacteraceae bacterium]